MIANFLVAAALTCDAALTAAFTPPRPRTGHYEVCTSADNLDIVMAAQAGEGVHYSPVEQVEVLDAFGAGPYNRTRLAQLYRGGRVQVARGWRERDGRFESFTLISPYPGAALDRIHAGTMAIRLELPR